MILGALVDAGAPLDLVRAELARLAVAGFSLERREIMKGAFRATKVMVHLHEHDHCARHGAGTGHAHAPDTPPVPERTLPAIRRIIEFSGLRAPVRDAALRIFTRLADAEGRVHGVAADRVQFHDVGAVDAIVDITGACIALDLLGVEAVYCSALPIGGGMVRGSHGPMPVPAPGTAELLKGFPVFDNGVKRELVTPTGAAILTTLATGAGSMPAMTVTAVGYGAGTMELEAPNIVRVFIGETTGAAGSPAGGGANETILQVETTVDDMSPQLYESLMDRLFAAGALDVHLTPVLMKKSRPGVVVTALCEPGAIAGLTRACFEESTTIGVRWTTYQRQRLPREIVTVVTSLGSLAFKVSRLEGRVVTVTPEFEDVRRVAAERHRPVREVLDQARAEGRRLLA